MQHAASCLLVAARIFAAVHAVMNAHLLKSPTGAVCTAVDSTGFTCSTCRAHPAARQPCVHLPVTAGRHNVTQHELQLRCDLARLTRQCCVLCVPCRSIGLASPGSSAKAKKHKKDKKHKDKKEKKDKSEKSEKKRHKKEKKHKEAAAVTAARPGGAGTQSRSPSQEARDQAEPAGATGGVPQGPRSGAAEVAAARQRALEALRRSSSGS
jgi:hypothetical protein